MNKTRRVMMGASCHSSQNWQLAQCSALKSKRSVCDLWI